MNGESPQPVPIEDDDQPDRSNLIGPLLSLGTAVVVGVLLLRMAAPNPPDVIPPIKSVTAYPEDIPLIIDRVLPPAGAARPELVSRRPTAGLPPPWLFSSIAEAGQRLGLAVVAPSILPQSLFLQTVRWQLDSYVAIPGQTLVGMLQTWYATEESGGVLLLEQGPGVGVSDFAAPDGEFGLIQLGDGRRLLWVRGHRLRTDDAPGAGGWGGTELRLGVRAGSTRGWRLTSRTLTLEELTVIAEGMR